MTAQLILVPQISSLPAHEEKARSLLRWLIKREIVASLPTTCGQGGNGMAYAIGPGARRIAQHPEHLPYGRAHNGLEIGTDRCIYVPTRNFLDEAGCPECRRVVGVP